MLSRQLRDGLLHRLDENTELENKGPVNDIYRDLILERAHFIMTLCQKCGFIRRQEAKDTGNQYLGLRYLNGERKSLLGYISHGTRLEILHLAFILIQYLGVCGLRNPSERVKLEHKALDKCVCNVLG